MSERKDSRTQREADQIIRAASTDLEYVIGDISEHGDILMLRTHGDANVWRFADGYEKEIKKGHG